ncbi:hypothetical protein DLAC_03264 [Tieghemostelium lacteum]|uniref:F-box domain-containing protein n=1 Tax=Tieghemostelium lacteum TaxID=361077 RepID=A0A152A1Z7_TIELA|nr:hypothetical protein DLAC_03264 [Tieghemostelium lacteum]|eukprot:KYR00115.1 hypothetical protein DLAC_03264 [Tieghemostelium lacteum]
MEELKLVPKNITFSNLLDFLVNSLNALSEKVLINVNALKDHFLRLLTEKKEKFKDSHSLTLILPEEVMLHIFKFLSPIDLCRVCRVNSKWRYLAFDISLWRDICLQLLDGSNYLAYQQQQQKYQNNSNNSSNLNMNNCKSANVTPLKYSWGDNWYVGEYRKDSNWRSGKYSTTILRGHKGIVWSLLFESDSNTLISGSKDSTVKVWDCNDIGTNQLHFDDLKDSIRRCQKNLQGHNNGIICLGSTPTRLVSGSADWSLKIWDRKDGRCIGTIQTNSSVWSLQILGDSLICGCVNGTMCVFDLNTLNCSKILRGHTAPVRCLQAINHNGQDLVISGSYDKTIKIWDMNESRCVNTIHAHTHKINCLQYENGQLVSGSHDGLLKIWDMNGGLIHTLQGHDNMIHCLQFKGNKLLSGSYDSTIRLWDLKTGSHVNTIKGLSSVTCLKFNDSKLITGYEDSTIKIFDFSYNKPK